MRERGEVLSEASARRGDVRFGPGSKLNVNEHQFFLFGDLVFKIYLIYRLLVVVAGSLCPFQS